LIEDKTCEVKAALNDLTQAKEEINADVDALTVKQEELDVDFQKSVKHKDALDSAVEKKESELKRLTASIVSLREKGFSDEIVAKLCEISHRDGTEVWSVMASYEKCKMLETEAEKLEVSKRELQNEIQKLARKKKVVSDDLNSELNRLDQVSVEVAGVKACADVLKGFLKDGFSERELRSLRSGLKLVGVVGDPVMSVSRLVTSLGEFRKLLNLREKIDLAEKRLSLLSAQELEVKNSIEIVKQQGVQSVEDVKCQSERAIAETAALARDEFGSSMQYFKGQVRSIVNETSALLSQQVAELKETQELRVRFEGLIQPASALARVLGSAEDVAKVPASLVRALLQNLELWCRLKIPNAKIKADYNLFTEELQAGQFGFGVYRAYSLVGLAAEIVKREETGSKEGI
jgi:uncharacterized protein YoxC